MPQPTNATAQFDTHPALHATPTTTLYVRPSGNNSNDGLYWGTAKKDILGAFDALTYTVGGRIIFESGSYVDATNTDRGLWILGANDSNYAGTAPTGWRKFNGTLLLEGVPSIHTGGSRRPTAYLLGGSATDTAKPLFWFSGCQTSIELRNIASNTALARPMELGADSGTGLYTNNSGFVFDNVTLDARTGDASKGPCINATSAYWTYFRDCTFYANDVAAITTTNRAVYYMPGAVGSYHGLVWIRDTNFNGGGGVYSKATSSIVNFVIENVVQEPGSGGSAQAIFWWDAAATSNMAGQVLIKNCAQADQTLGASQSMVKVNPLIDPGMVAVTGPGSVDGPCTILGLFQAATNTSPASARALGFYGRRIIGEHNAHRRSFAPTAVRYANLANQDVTAWSGLTGSATVTTGVAAPDGSTNAARLSSASQQNRRVFSGSRTVAVGDWVIAGVWARSNSGTWPASMPEVDWSASDDLFDASAAGVNFFTLSAPHTAATKEWVWLARAYKVTQASTTPATLIFYLFSDAAGTVDYFAPVLHHIATGTYTDAEVLEIYQNLGAYPSTASVGQLAMLHDQPLHIPRGYIEMGEMTAPAAGATNFGRLFMEDNGAGKTRLVVRFPTGANQVIATEP